MVRDVCTVYILLFEEQGHVICLQNPRLQARNNVTELKLRGPQLEASRERYKDTTCIQCMQVAGKHCVLV